MNLLLFEECELKNSQLKLNDRRAEHIISILGSSVGDTLRVGMLEGKIGFGTVVLISNKEVLLDVELVSDPSKQPRINLILALPRPIMLQRILKQATVMGVKSFHLIRSKKVEKSFFQSPVLHPAKIKSLMMEGLEQAMDTRLPDIQIHSRFKPFVEDFVPDVFSQNCLLAHPLSRKSLSDCMKVSSPSVDYTLAIGPEGGWNEYEIQMFQNQGFSCFTMGARILHVDTVVVALLAQVSIIQDFLHL